MIGSFNRYACNQVSAQQVFALEPPTHTHTHIYEQTNTNAARTHTYAHVYVQPRLTMLVDHNRYYLWLLEA